MDNSNDNILHHGTYDYEVVCSGSGADKNLKISVIIPVRENSSSDYASRIELRSDLDLTTVQTIIVDDGSQDEFSSRMINICSLHGWDYVKIDSSHHPFSSSRARNVGLKCARAEWVYLDDADIAYENDHFQRVIKEIDCFSENNFNFITIPTIYMSEKQTHDYLNKQSLFELDLVKTRNLIENPLGSDSNTYIQHFAPASGIFLLRRKLALAVGGYDEDFNGWGGEDRDFAYRLLLVNDEIVKPRNFEITKPWNLNDTHVYEGWRSLYKLHGEYSMKKGLYAFHLYHEPYQWKLAVSDNNFIKLAEKKSKSYSKIPSIACPRSPVDIILGYNPFISNIRIRLSLNNPFMIDEDTTISPEDFAHFIALKNPNSVTMWNPYGTTWRLQLYKSLLKLGIVPIVAERGALPDSLYFDKGGLCIESDRYGPSYWDKPIDEQARAKVEEYLDELRYGDAALERQSKRKGRIGVRAGLGINDDTKILLAPLQLYDDTVTTFFSEPNRGYDNYISELRKISLGAPDNWVVVYKNHPLSLRRTDIPGAVCGDEYHINDLIEASSMVMVFNSGTGLIASAFDKPVAYYGPCFYANKGINFRFEDAKHLFSLLKDVPNIEVDRRNRFFYYLRYEFYSFARMVADSAVHSKDSKRSKLKNITYREVRIPGFPSSYYREDIWDPWRSVLFDVFRHERIASKAQKSVAADPVRIEYLQARKLYHEGRYIEAAQKFELIAKKETGSAQALRCAAECYVQLGDIKTAKHLLVRATAIIPHNKLVRKRLKKLDGRTILSRLGPDYRYDVPQV